MSCVLHRNVVVLGIALALTAGAAAEQLAVGQPFPDLSAARLEGDLPPTLKGHVVIVDFFASWCGPCRLAMPFLSTLQDRYREAGLVVVGVSVDTKAKDMRAFLARTPVSFVTVRDAAQALAAACDIAGMPTSFILDRTGIIRHVHNGFHQGHSEALFEQQVRALLQAE